MSDLPFSNHRNEVERQILVSLVTELLAYGFSIRVHNGECVNGTVLDASRDEAAIFAAMGTTDRDTLWLSLPPGHGTEVFDLTRCLDSNEVGAVLVTYGNDGYVISDYAAVLGEHLWPRTHELAGRFQGRPR